MASHEIKNIDVSIRQRLLNLSRKTEDPFDLLLTRFGLERLLFRLAQSEWRDQFLLKGAMLFALWFEGPTRPTRDVDLLGLGEADFDHLSKIFKKLCLAEGQADGLVFDPEKVLVLDIRRNNVHLGLRVKLEAELAGARIPLQVDVGFGDSVVPEPVEVTYPTLLGHPAPKLRAYPVYTVIAEKLEAMVTHGMANSRMKDFYDLWVLSERMDFDGSDLVAAIRATFKCRQIPIPSRPPIAMTEEFSLDPSKIRQWKSFLDKSSLDGAEMKLEDIIDKLRAWLWPAIRVAAGDEGTTVWDRTWLAGGTWQEGTTRTRGALA